MATLRTSREVQSAMSAAVRYITVQTDQEAVELFVEQLGSFHLDDWLSVAKTSWEAKPSQETLAGLDGLVAELQLGVDAWSVADDVETAAQYSLASTQLRLSPRDCESLRVARQAAATAALALFVRPLLPAGDFESLYRPFSSLVPLKHESRPRRSREGGGPWTAWGSR